MNTMFTSEHVLAEIRKGQESMAALAQDITRAIMESLDRATARLYASGVAIKSMMLWSDEHGRRGVMVGEKYACTIEMKVSALIGVTMGLDVETVWHAPYAHLNDMDPAGDQARIAELRRLVGG